MMWRNQNITLEDVSIIFKQMILYAFSIYPTNNRLTATLLTLITQLRLLSLIYPDSLSSNLYAKIAKGIKVNAQ
jgi:hypothetical protein